MIVTIFWQGNNVGNSNNEVTVDNCQQHGDYTVSWSTV